MPLKKRLTPAQRAESKLPDGWQDVLHYPALKAMTTYGEHPSDALSVYAAYERVANWNKPSIRDMVFVLYLSEVLLRVKGTEAELLDKRTWLQCDRYLRDNVESIIDKAGLQYHSAFVWDFQPLRRFRPGTLHIELPARKKRKRLPKHAASTPAPPPRKRVPKRKP